MPAQPELDLACDPVMDLDEAAPWDLSVQLPARPVLSHMVRLQPAGPPALERFVSAIGSALAGAILGMVKP